MSAPERWWTSFSTPGLDSLVDAAFRDNLNLEAAWQRVRAARAVTDRTAALGVPAVDASADARRRDGSGDDEGAGGSERSTDGTALTLDLAASWEVDLWGRIGARVDADALRRDATRADFQAAALSLSAEVARTWVALAEAGSQVELLGQQIDTNETVLQLLENRFGSGQVRAVDILRQRQLLESTEENAVRAEERRQLLVHQLAVLLGRPPQRAPGLRPDSLPLLPPLPATGVPLELVRRRPDVQAAFLRLRAADRDVAAAVSDRFPRLTLSASVATEGASAGTLFQDWLSSLGGNLLAPLFYGGELEAEVERARAVREERLAAYGQAVLVALREVEDALVREARQREAIDRIEAQVELAEQTSEQLRLQYFNGTSNYLDVLTALDEVQGLRRDLLAARLTLVQVRIGLYRALAGPLPDPRET